MGEQGEEEVTLRRAQAEVDASILALGGYWPPLANLARLFEECGELARAVNQLHGPKPPKVGETPSALVEEWGDVLYVLLALANALELDATSSLVAALRKARQRVASAGRPAGPSDPDAHEPNAHPQGGPHAPA